MSEPVDAGPQRFGDWVTIGGDASGKRVAVRCLRCQHVGLVSADALEHSHVACPGCSKPRNVGEPKRTFAGELVALETRGARKVKWGGGREP
jgi:hypothetical protein